MRERLIGLFKNTNYNIFPNSTVNANLANQFSDYALNDVVDKLLANGVIVPPCKVGDEIYVVSRYCGGCWGIIYGKVFEIIMDGTNTFMRISESNDGAFTMNSNQIGKTVFFTKEEAENALKARERE